MQDLEEAIIDELVRRGLVIRQKTNNRSLLNQFTIGTVVDCYLDIVDNTCYCRLRRRYTLDLRDPDFMDKLVTLIRQEVFRSKAR